jgi:hypothetical protein
MANDEAVLLADDVTVGQLAGLVIDGLATMRATLVPRNGREKPVNLDEDHGCRAKGDRGMTRRSMGRSLSAFSPPELQFGSRLVSQCCRVVLRPLSASR